MHFVSFQTKNKHLIKTTKKTTEKSEKKNIKLLHFNVTGDRNFVDHMNFACLMSEREKKR